jgi:hypothetical protein
VEANAAIAQHRDEMEQDATNAESSEIVILDFRMAGQALS